LLQYTFYAFASIASKYYDNDYIDNYQCHHFHITVTTLITINVITINVITLFDKSEDKSISFLFFLHPTLYSLVDNRKSKHIHNITAKKINYNDEKKILFQSITIFSYIYEFSDGNEVQAKSKSKQHSALI
jgi:hypothetical protein